MQNAFFIVSLFFIVAVISVVSYFLPESIICDGVIWAHRLVFAGGVFSAILFQIIKFAKGDTTKLLKHKSLNDIQKHKLAKVISWRSSYLRKKFFTVVITMCLSYGFFYFYSKGYIPYYLLRISFVLAGISFWLLIPVFNAWIDYEKAKELLDARECGVEDII